MICDRQTDGQTDAQGKTICLPTLKGGDIIKLTFELHREKTNNVAKAKTQISLGI